METNNFGPNPYQAPRITTEPVSRRVQIVKWPAWSWIVPLAAFVLLAIVVPIEDYIWWRTYVFGRGPFAALSWPVGVVACCVGWFVTAGVIHRWLKQRDCRGHAIAGVASNAVLSLVLLFTEPYIG